MSDGQYVEGSYWFYAPNKAAPIFFAIAFGASSLLHCYQSHRHHSWLLTGFYSFCGLLFTTGFIVRELGAYNYSHIGILIASNVLVYSAPPLCEMANYIVLGRILYYVPYHSPIHPGRVFTTFAAISGIVEGLNGWGINISINPDNDADFQELGHRLMKACLFIQVFVITSFVGLGTWFQRRCRKAGIVNRNIDQALLTLYISSFLIFCRTIYRMVEYFALAPVRFDQLETLDPNDFTSLIRYEWYFYVFEASLMLANTWLINWRHPRRFLPQSKKVYLSRDGETELLGPGYKEERVWFMTLLDPFDVWGLVIGRDKKTRFWEQHEADTVVGEKKEEGSGSGSGSGNGGAGDRNVNVIGSPV